MTSESSEARNGVQVALEPVFWRQRTHVLLLSRVEKMLRITRKEKRNVFFALKKIVVSYFMELFPKTKEQKAKPKG